MTSPVSGSFRGLPVRENVPFLDAGVRNAGHECNIAIAQEHSVFLRGDDTNRAFGFSRLNDQRLRNERLDDIRGNAGDDLLNRFAINLGLSLEVDWFADFQPRAAARHVEHDDVARVNTVRILDLGLVHLPDIGPAPRLFEELAGNSPECVAGDNDMAVGRVVDQGEWFGSRCADGRHSQNERGYNANHVVPHVPVERGVVGTV